MIITGENIWIIGGSSGIGAALAEAFAKAGAKVVISGRDEKALADMVEKIGPALVAARADAVDVASLEAELAMETALLF